MSRSLAGRVRWSLIGVAALTAVLAVGVFLTAWALYTVRVRSDELARQISAIAKGQEAFDRQVRGANARDLHERLFRVEAALIGARLAVTDANGTVVESSADNMRQRFPIGQLRARQGGTRGSVVRVQGIGQTLVVAAPLTGGRWLVAVQPLGEIRGAVAWVPAALAASAAAALLVSWGVGSLLARRVTDPLRRLKGAAERLGSGEWGHQVPVEGDDEVSSLARSFNTMSSRLAAAYDAQAAFVGDVSHELRTPITSIQGFAGALTDGTVTEPEQQRRYLGVIRDEAARLGDLTRTLLALSDLDSGAVQVSRAPVDVAGLAEALDARYAGAAREAGLDLRIEVLGGCPLGDEARLLQAASALVENALHYTPAPGTVTVRSEQSAGGWRLHVEDSGPGVPPEKRQAVFGRFTRLDPSRSASGGGSGLGLAIAARLLALMGGGIRVEGSPLGGADFVLELPSA